MNNKAIAIPHGYEACLSSNCSQREHCLRAWVWNHRDKSVQRYVVLNPDLTTPDGHCPFYCDDQPQRYALGFTNFQRRLYPDQYQQFMSACIARFGRNPYFMRRRGDTPISPSEQAYIRGVLKQVGAPEDLDFDGFEERINWYGD